MIKDKALEELFLTQRPHFDDHDAFMDVLTRRLDVVEYLKQHQDTTIRRYKLVMIVAFIVGILSGAVTMAFVLSTPFDVSLFNFHVHTGFLLELSEISRPIVAAALTLLMTVGIISLISNIQDINNIMKMKKKTIITMILALVTMMGQEQEIKMNETTINDYIPMLNAKGYQAYSFDVSAIKGRNATFNVREFVNGKEVEDSPRLLFPYYFEARGDKLVYGFLPSETDSLALCYFNWENTLRSAWSLKLKQLYWESEDKYVYSYRSDPFEPTSPLEKDTFIPLVYYSSFWYDAEDKITRCCGSISDIIKRSPHYYILGIMYY